MLKIAGVKTESAFYKKFPNQEAFMKVHGKEFKKAQTANAIDKAQQGITQGFGQTPKFQYQDTFVPGNNYTPGNFNPIDTSIDTMSGFTHKDSFANQNYGDQWIKNNPIPEKGTGQISNRVFAEDKSVTKGLGTKDYSKNQTLTMPYANSAMDVIQGVSMLKGEKQIKNQAKQNSLVTGIQANAAESRDADIPRQRQDYTNRERNAFMHPITGEELFPVNGVGTNVLAQNGSQIQDNDTEIQNTFDPYDIYDDGGYEPLNDSEQVKTYQMGGDIAGQIEPYATAASNKYINQGGAPDAGSMIGGGIGGAAGMAFGGPLGAAIGKFAGSTIGGLIDTNDRETKKYTNQATANINRVTNQAFGKGIQAQNASYMENGGNVNPQIISKFGDHTVEDYYDYTHEYDTLRSGGSIKPDYEPISEKGMQTSALGGSIKTLWGGEVKPISHNPYMPNSGETVNFYGQSHDDGGIGVKYGEGGETGQAEQASVEVEKGEPSFEMPDSKTGAPTLNVLGDRKVHASFAKQIGDPELIKISEQYNGKKFKNIGLELSKKENKYTSIIDKATKDLKELTPTTQFDKLKLNSLEKTIEGAHFGLKKIANTKMTLTHYQNAINDTADELSEYTGKDISSGNLNKGKVMFGKDKGQIAKYGANIKLAKYGTTTDETTGAPISDVKSTSAMNYVPTGQHSTGTYWGNVDSSKFEQLKNNNPWFDWDKFDPSKKGEISRFQNEFNTASRLVGSNAKLVVDDRLGEQTASAKVDLRSKEATIAPTTTPNKKEEDKVYDVKAGKRSPYIDAGNQLLKYFRPSDSMSLDPQELTGEMYALSNNQVDPVQARFYHPELNVPYDISLQDQMNEVTAQTRAAQRLVGYNPAAQAQIASQAYEPINKIKGEEFRDNQAMKNQVYTGNRATLNDAQIKNLGIADNQYTRQESAKSNTKAINQAALSSISSKYLQNKLENNKNKVNENMYNYRFGKDFVADNYNGIFQPNMPNVYDKGDQKANMLPVYDANGKITGFRQMEDEVQPITATAKNGNAIKARNGSIVSAYRNL